MGEGPEAGGGIPQPLSHSASPADAWGQIGSTDPMIGALLERAQQLEGDTAGLLALLRAIEAAHRAIQEGPFRASLPEDRNRLFDLLADMERSGGWPYIPRLQLRTFLDLLQPEPLDTEAEAGSEAGAETSADDGSGNTLAA